MERASLLEVESLSIDLGEFHLRDIDLTVEKGNYLTIIGPTGAGKSILLEAIVGFYSLKSGRIILKGQDITNLPPEKRGISIVYQDYVLFPYMSVFDNIAFGLRKLKKDGVRKEVVWIAKELHINHLLHRKPVTLSGGEQQRVALARALVVNPNVLLMDEPFSALDPKTRERFRGLVKSVITKYGTTVIHITHDFEDVFALANKVAVMKDGKILQIGSPEDVFSQPDVNFVAGFVGTNILRGKIVGKDKELALVDIGGVVLRTIDQAKGTVTLSLRPEEIILAKDPGLCSAQNDVPVIVEDLKKRGNLFWVYLDGALNLKAVITPNAVEFLGIKREMKLHVLFKASSLRVIR